MFSVTKSKGIVVVLAFIFVIGLTTMVRASVPNYIYYRNEADQLVKVDYSEALNKPSLLAAFKVRLAVAELYGRQIIVQTDDEKFIDYQKALYANKTLSAMIDDPDYAIAKPTATKELVLGNDGREIEQEIEMEVLKISFIS